MTRYGENEVFSIKLCGEIVFLLEIGLCDEIISIGIAKKKKTPHCDKLWTFSLDTDRSDNTQFAACLFASASLLLGVRGRL